MLCMTNTLTGNQRLRYNIPWAKCKQELRMIRPKEGVMKRSDILPAVVLAAAVVAASAILGGCGGGGGGGATPLPKPQLSGTVASGGAHAGARIIVKDGNGNTRTGTTDSSGKYAIDTDGLTPPFFLVASTGTQTF